MDVNKAGKAALLRVPGFGVRNVKRILEIRRYRSLDSGGSREVKMRCEPGQVSSLLRRTIIPRRKQIDSVKLPQRARAASGAHQMSLFEAAGDGPQRRTVITAPALKTTSPGAAKHGVFSPPAFRPRTCSGRCDARPSSMTGN